MFCFIAHKSIEEILKEYNSHNFFIILDKM